jgi:hypothetical protein
LSNRQKKINVKNIIVVLRLAVTLREAECASHSEIAHPSVGVWKVTECHF